MLVAQADASGPAAVETVSKKKREAVAEGEAPVVVIGGPTEKRDRLVLIFGKLVDSVTLPLNLLAPLYFYSWLYY